MTPTEFILKLDYEKFNDILENYTRVNPSNWQQELNETPSAYAWLAACAETAKMMYDEKKTNTSIADAEFRRVARNKIVKVSESKLNSEVFLDEKYRIALSEEREAEQKYGWMRAIVFAMRLKHESLIQLSANNRKEIELHR